MMYYALFDDSTLTYSSRCLWVFSLQSVHHPLTSQSVTSHIHYVLILLITLSLAILLLSGILLLTLLPSIHLPPPCLLPLQILGRPSGIDVLIDLYSQWLKSQF